MPVLSEIEQYSIVGGGDGSAGNPYTVMEFEGMCESGSWRGGYVEGWGYIFQDVVVDSTNNDDNKLNNNIINFCGFILSMSEDVVNKGGKYIRVVNYSLSITQYLNSGINIYTSKEISANELYNIAITTIGLSGTAGAATATMINLYKDGFEYFVDVVIEVDNYFNNLLNPTTGIIP